MQTLAAIDMGSNGIRMLVGSVSSQDQVEALQSFRVPVRLGQDVFSSGSIGEAGMQAALDAFLRFKKIAAGFDAQRIRAIATSAMREARNARALIDLILSRTGIHVEVISAQEEARLIHLAISRVIDLTDRKAMLIDMGGGSMEVTLSHGDRIVSAESYPAGAVRLLRQVEAGQDPSAFRALLAEYTGPVRRRIKRKLGKQKLDLCIGTGGNLVELGNLRKKVLKRPDGDSISLRELARLTARMSAMSLEQRVRKLGLRPDRADVILPAAMLLELVVKEAGFKQILLPRVGLKEGLLWDMAPLASGNNLPLHDQARLSAMRLGQKYHFDSRHALRVARTARRLFNQTRSLHKLGDEQGLLLEMAALLHDIGHFVNSLGHEQHGYYLVRNSPLVGLDERGQELVAQLVRCHRKQDPLGREAGPDRLAKALPSKARLILLKLCALLRLADAIEVSHTGRVHAALLAPDGDGWQLALQGEGSLLLEHWSLAKGKLLFEQVFDQPLKVLD